MSALLNAIPIGAAVLALALACLGPNGSALALAAGLIAVAVPLHRRLFGRSERRLLALVDAETRRHREALARRRLSLVTTDPYGLPEEEPWRREVERFLDRVVAPGLAGWQRAGFERRREALVARVDARVAARAVALERDLGFRADMGGEDFERWCQAVLRRAGWATRRTGASGDQGADLVAEKPGLSVVLQCKLYGRPVGNKAIQEAHAARSHYGTAAAAVVTNAAYTRSARHLAATTGVLLLHHGDLARLEERLAGSGPV